MTKEEVKQMIITRIKTEYRKYHGTPVDFMESAAIKIVAALAHNDEQKQTLPLHSVSKSVTAADLKCPKCKQHALIKYSHRKECISCGHVC